MYTLKKKTIINIISSRTQSCKSSSSVSSKTRPPSPGIFTRTADHTINQFYYPKERNQKLTRESSTVTPKRASKKIRKDMENLRLCICLSEFQSHYVQLCQCHPDHRRYYRS